VPGVILADVGDAPPESGRLTMSTRGPCPPSRPGGPGDACYAVVRGPCYLAVATLVAHPGPPVDGIVLLPESGRAVSADDVVAATGLPVVATVPVSAPMARTIDAGRLATRAGSAMSRSHSRALRLP
jgi:hypothetical protein